MEAEVCRKIDLGFDAPGCPDNIDFLESHKDFNTCRLGDFQNAGKQVDIGLGTDMDGQLTEVLGSSDPAQTWTRRRYNLRKSLAWDTAFFTSAGVLEPEELSNLITGADKGDKHLLPGIQEDIRCSTESISTLESDSFNVETLEDDLFVDIRASIIRSSKSMPNSTISHSKKTDVEVDCASNISLEKESVAPQNNKAKPGSRKTHDLPTKSLPKLNIVKLGSGKAVRHDAGRPQATAIVKIGDKSPIITSKSKTTGRSPSTTTMLKQGSVGTGLSKLECGISKHASTSSKGTDGATRLLPRPALSSRPSLSGLSTTTRVQSTRSNPSGGSHGVSSGTNTKSQLMMAKRIPGRSSVDEASPSGFTPKTPGSVPKKKPISSTLSAYLRSNKISSSVSPASSVSEWSSVSSSSSSSMTNNRLKFKKERTSLDRSSSCKSVDSYINRECQKRNPLAEQAANESKNQGVNLPISNSKNTTANGIAPASMKPSGLRMPSPKLGFFDGVKSSPSTPNSNRLSQLRSQSIFPKNGTALGNSPICRTSKCAKVPRSRAATSFTRTKQDSPKPSSAKSSRGKIYRSQSDISDLTSVKDSPSLYLNIEGNANEEGIKKPEKVICEGGLTLSDLNSHENMGSGDIPTYIMGRNASSVEIIDRILDELANQCLANDEKENALDKYQSICELKCKLLSDTSDGTLHSPVKTAAAAKRSPFAPKNKFCIDGSKKLGTRAAAADKMSFALPSEEKENS